FSRSRECRHSTVLGAVLRRLSGMDIHNRVGFSCGHYPSTAQFLIPGHFVTLRLCFAFLASISDMRIYRQRWRPESLLPRLGNYHGFSDEVPFPQVESPGTTQGSHNILSSDPISMKEDKTDSSAFSGCKRAFQQGPAVAQERVGRFRG